MPEDLQNYGNEGTKRRKRTPIGNIGDVEIKKRDYDQEDLAKYDKASIGIRENRFNPFTDRSAIIDYHRLRYGAEAEKTIAYARAITVSWGYVAFRLSNEQNRKEALEDTIMMLEAGEKMSQKIPTDHMVVYLASLVNDAAKGDIDKKAADIVEQVSSKVCESLKGRKRKLDRGSHSGMDMANIAWNVFQIVSGKKPAKAAKATRGKAAKKEAPEDLQTEAIEL